MSELKKCPDCGAEITSDCEFCPDCGADLRNQRNAEVERTASSPSNEPASSGKESEGLTFGEGSRTNIGGNVSSSTSNVDNSVSHVSNHVQSSNTVNESHIDQSSTVNSTTIIQNAKSKEYCSVCGKVLDENHARCPQCGKNVCIDCLVKGKNRCTKCEKQAVNEFRMAVKQVFLSSGGQLTFTEKEMLQQRALQLDVEEVKDKIMKEAQAACRPTPRASQPIGGGVSGSQENSNDSQNSSRLASKGVGVLDQRQPINTANSKSSGGGSSSWLWIVIIALGLGGYFLFSGDDEEYVEEKPSVQQVENSSDETTAPVPMAPATPKVVSNESSASKSVPSSSKNTPSAPQKVAKKVDQHYSKGMQAYNANEGLEAVSLFKKSGTAQAYYMLGVIYESGCGNVGANPMMARKYFKKAAAMGSEEAKGKL